MPQSKKRPGHTYQKPADIPSAQRTTGHLIWSLLVGVFGLLIGYFATNGNITAVIVGGLAGLVVGWIVGRRMEQDVKGK